MGRLLLFLGLWIGSGSAGGAGSFVVVVHQSNPNTNLMFADVRAFFSGATKQWPNGSKVVLVERDAGSATHQFLLEHILHMTSVEYKRHLLSIEFAGEAPVALKVLNSEQAACKFVFNVPGAIALIEIHSLNLAECGGLATVRIDGRLPGQEGYRLR
jgi:ABC-type phosphate transport system substrate-binding protein